MTNERTIQSWFQKFRDGDETFEDHEGRAQKTVINNDRLKALVEANPRTSSVRELTGDLGVTI